MSRNQPNSYPSPVSVRFTPDERILLERSAGRQSLSAFIRDQVLSGRTAKRSSRAHTPVKDGEALARVLGMLGQSRIANNLNQLAREANCGSLLLDEETHAQIEEAYRHVVTMRAELVRALGLLEKRSR